MMKIGWSLYTKKDDLWILVIRSKYKCENDIVPLMNSKRSDSNLRRGIYSSRENVQNNLAWNIGDGTSIDFWKHEWVPFRGKLLGIASCPIPVDRVSNKVCLYTNQNGEWNLKQLQSLLPTQVLDILRTIPPPIA